MDKDVKLELKALRMTLEERYDVINDRINQVEKKLRLYNVRIGDNETQILNMKNITKEVVDNGLGDRKTK